MAELREYIAQHRRQCRRGLAEEIDDLLRTLYYKMAELPGGQAARTDFVRAMGTDAQIVPPVLREIPGGRSRGARRSAR